MRTTIKRTRALRVSPPEAVPSNGTRGCQGRNRPWRLIIVPTGIAENPSRVEAPKEILYGLDGIQRVADKTNAPAAVAAQVSMNDI